MSGLEVALSLTAAALGVLLVVTWGLLLGARRRIAQLKRSLQAERPRPRLTVPRPADAVRTVVGTAISLKDKGLGGTLRSSIDDLARWADVERPDLARMATPDGTVAILFSDIEGSTALNHELGDGGWVRLLAKHDAVATRAVGRHGGHVGVHRGSAVHRDGDLFGRNVAYAARVAAQADGGEVLVSDTVLEALEADGTPVPVLESREVDLKGIPGTQVVHALDWQV